MKTTDGLPEGPGFDPLEPGSVFRTIAWYREQWRLERQRRLKWQHAYLKARFR
jgi:hypothetical protein